MVYSFQANHRIVLTILSFVVNIVFIVLLDMYGYSIALLYSMKRMAYDVLQLSANAHLVTVHCCSRWYTLRHVQPTVTTPVLGWLLHRYTQASGFNRTNECF